MDALETIFYERVGEAIKSLRDNGLSNVLIAERVGVSESTIRCWKGGGAVPSALGLKNLADLVGWNVGYFFDTDASKSSLSGQETELVKVFRGLSIRGQTALMGAAYNIEEDEAQRGGGDVPPAGAASEPVSAAPKRGSAGALVGSDVGAGVRG